MKRKRLLGGLLALLMLFNIGSAFPVGVWGDDPPTGTDVTDILKRANGNFSDIWELKTDEHGTPITVITPGESFWLGGSFVVPGAASSATDYVYNDDYAYFPLDADITPVGSSEFELKDEYDEIIGHLIFNPTERPNTIKIKFDGTAMDDTALNATVSFGATLKYTGTGLDEGESKTNVYILGKAFTVTRPLVGVTKNIIKSGTIDKDEIEWKVKVNALKGTSPVSLKGYKFQDNLSNTTHFGAFVPGSFAITPAVTDMLYTLDANNVLSYTFTDDVSGEHTISFRTKIPADKLLGGTNNSVRVTNTGQFGKDEDFKDHTISVPIPPKKFITKSGQANDDTKLVGGNQVYDPENQTITWTIKIDPKDLALKKVVITDLVSSITPGNHEFKEAYWQWPNATGEQADITLPKTIADKYSTEPAGGRYELGNNAPLTKPVELVIVTKAPKQDYSGSMIDYKNTAKLTWEGGPSGGQSDEKSVGVGVDSLKKAAGNIDYQNRQIPWTVTVDLKGQTHFTDSNLFKVYDLVIYGKEGSFDATKSNLASLVELGIDASKITPRYDQKIVEDSWTGIPSTNGLTHDIKSVIDTTTNKPIGDLLVVTGFTNNAEKQFTFKTQVLNPKIFARSDEEKASTPNVYVKNDASLFYDTLYLDNGTDSKAYISNVLSKGILEAGKDTDGNINNGFDIENRTAVFKLNINTDGYDLSSAKIPDSTATDGTKDLGPVKVTDTLPEGWSFNQTYGPEGDGFRIFKKDSGASTYTEMSTGRPTVYFATLGNGIKTATFTFDPLNTAYYILVEVELSEAQYLEYLKDAYKTSPPKLVVPAKNELKMTADGAPSWNPGSSESVNIPTELLTKTHLQSAGVGSDLTVTWTIKFNPYNLADFQNGDTEITDTLPEGLDLGLTQEGTLSPEAVTITEYTPQSDGKFPSSGDSLDTATLLANGRLSYDPVKRILTFKPTPGKLCKIIYVTEVSRGLENGTKLTNNVTVSNTALGEAGTGKEWAFDKTWADSKVERVGMIKIFKKGAPSIPLQGVEFTLYTDANCTNAILSATTDVNGIAYIRSIPTPKSQNQQWVYYLKESKPKDGYAPDPTVHEVTVELAEKSTGIFRPLVVIEGEYNSFIDGSQLEIINHLESSVGSLSISKTVVSDSTDASKTREYSFKIEIPGTSDAFTYTGDKSGSIRHGEYINLKHGQSVIIHNLPAGTTVTVTEETKEDDYIETTYQVVGGTSGTKLGPSVSASAEIIAKGLKEIHFINSQKVGDLKITKNSSGNFPESIYPSEKFSFSLSLREADGSTILKGTYTYTISKNKNTISNGTIKPESTPFAFSLAKDETFTITGLPESAEFTVIETVSDPDLATTWFIDSTSNGAGKVASNSVEGGKEITFTNVRNNGNLVIIKQAPGHYPDPNPKFKFTLKLTDSSNNELTTGNYSYSFDSKPGTSYPLLLPTQDFELVAGDSIIIKDLPEGTQYEITETGDKYVATAYQIIDGKSGNGATVKDTLVPVDGSTVIFTNTRETGNLTLSKTVVGNLPNPDKKFKFTLDFKESDNTIHSGSYSYIANGTAGDDIVINGNAIPIPASGTITIPSNGENHGTVVLELKKDQSITIQNIPKGIKYTITEEDYRTERITTTNTGSTSSPDGLVASGSINGGIPAVDNHVAYTNTRRSGTLPTDPDPTQPTTTPSEPTETTGPSEGPTEPTESTEPTDATGPTEPTETTAPTEPTYPTIPTENVPDPNNPDSPDDFILIDENGTPQGRYTKAPQPDGSFVYLDENGIPLGQRPIPRTGDQSNLILWAIVLTLSLAGAGWLLLPQFSLGRRKH